MGFGVGQSRNGLGALTISLFLFDRAAGGAGFAVSFEHLMRAVIKGAEHVLDCKTPGCEKGCAACVLTSDAPDGKDDLDRTAALEFLREYLVFPHELGRDDCFAEGAELSIAPLDEIDRELRRANRSSLTVFLPDRSAPASMHDWPLAVQLLHWTMRGHPMRLAISPNHMEKLSPAEKLAVRDFSLQHNTVVLTGEAPTFGNGASTLAMVAADSDTYHVWTSREIEPRSPGPAWGLPISHPVVRGRTSIVPKITAVNLNTLLPPPEAQLVQIGSELDCDIATFGDRIGGHCPATDQVR